jgi:hypothetical protein
VVLLLLLVATVIMPVDYEAGADRKHAHTISQGVIDAITGHSHHHAHPADPPSGLPDPLRSEPDVPHLLGSSMPITSLAAVQDLGLLIAALLAGALARPIWRPATHLLNRSIGVETLPPRQEWEMAGIWISDFSTGVILSRACGARDDGWVRAHWMLVV